MNILRQFIDFLTPRGAPSGSDGDVGLYYYIRCNRCGEVIRVRINPNNDLSVRDKDQRFTRKTIVGQKCYNRIEAEFTYSASRKLTGAEITGGVQVTQEDYEAYRAEA